MNSSPFPVIAALDALTGALFLLTALGGRAEQVQMLDAKPLAAGLAAFQSLNGFIARRVLHYSRRPTQKGRMKKRLLRD